MTKLEKFAACRLRQDHNERRKDIQAMDCQYIWTEEEVDRMIAEAEKADPLIFKQNQE